MDGTRGTGEGAQVPEPQPIRLGPVVGGILLGVVLAVVVQAFLVIFFLSGAVPVEQTPGLMTAVFLVPGLVGAGLLLRRRTRQMGAGLVLGLSVGAIVAAGVCTAIDAMAV